MPGAKTACCCCSRATTWHLPLDAPHKSCNTTTRRQNPHQQRTGGTPQCRWHSRKAVPKVAQIYLVEIKRSSQLVMHAEHKSDLFRRIDFINFQLQPTLPKILRDYSRCLFAKPSRVWPLLLLWYRIVFGYMRAQWRSASNILFCRFLCSITALEKLLQFDLRSNSLHGISKDCLDEKKCLKKSQLWSVLLWNDYFWIAVSCTKISKMNWVSGMYESSLRHFGCMTSSIRNFHFEHYCSNWFCNITHCTIPTLNYTNGKRFYIFPFLTFRILITRYIVGQWLVRSINKHLLAKLLAKISPSLFYFYFFFVYNKTTSNDFFLYKREVGTMCIVCELLICIVPQFTCRKLCPWRHSMFK